MLQNRLADDISRQDPDAIIIIESALIFESKHGGNWRKRFDKIVLVCAPETLKIARFIARSPAGDQAALAAEAARRLARMIPDGDKVHRSDYVIRNDSTLERLQCEVARFWDWLK